MNRVEKKLLEKIRLEPDLSAITPGIQIDVHSKGKRVAQLAVGDTYKYYDLASLTKIIFGATTFIQHFGDHRRALKRPVRDVLPWWSTSRTRPFDLMTHSAGLEWWLPFYKKLKGPMVPELRWEQFKEHLQKIKPGRLKKAVYSDLDIWTMGAYLEAARGQSFLQMWDEVYERLKLQNIWFHPGNKPRYARSQYAPTERCPWRKKILRGEVHDENTWSLAGVAMNAGLFGDLESVSEWGLKLRSAFLGNDSILGEPTVVRRFTKRQIPVSVGDWGLGFMKPSKGSASCGRHFSRQSFGHTGFTGTSLWYDPRRDLLAVILSNRVHPTRENKAFVRFRPLLHDWIVESLDY